MRGSLLLVLVALATSSPDNLAADEKPCALLSEALRLPAIHKDLLARPSQFHNEFKGGVLVRPSTGSRSGAWFDFDNLQAPVPSPKGVTIEMSLPGTLLVHKTFAGPCCREMLGILKRGESRPRWIGTQWAPRSAIESRSGEIWVIAIDTEASGRPHLVHVSPTGKMDNRVLPLPAWARDAELALTADNRPALIFVRREGDRVRLLLSWTLDPSVTVVLDEVQVPLSVAKLAEATHFGVAVAKDGEHGLGVVWRPLTEKNPEASWERDAAAEVRWVTVEPSSAPTRARRHPTVAKSLGGVTGIGPWGLKRAVLKAGQFGQRAFFAWIEGTEIRGARSTDITASLLGQSGSNEWQPRLILLQSRDDGLDLILLDNLPWISAFRISCR